ncbi:MAG: PKD domain-containing protein [Saprospiraceae bacterium]
MKYSNVSIFVIFSILLFSSSCKKDDSTELEVEARFTTPIIEYGVVTFKNYSLNATDYLWEFQDGNISTEKDPTHEYFELGIFDVKLTASNGDESDVFLLKVAIGQIYPENLTQLSDLPFGSRTQMIHFTKNGKGYIAGGVDYSDFQYKTDLWEFDPSDYSWTLTSEELPINLSNATNFIINEKVYFGFGNSNFGTEALAFYSYSFQNSSFQYECNLPSNQASPGQLIDPVGFAHDGFGYLIGRDQNDNTQKRMWEFNPSAQEWTEFGTYSCEGNAGMFHFIINEKLYIGLGNEYSYSSFDSRNDVWAYDLTNNTWAKKNDFPGVGRRDGISFTHNGKGYFGFGLNADPITGAVKSFSDLWEYDIVADSWTKIVDMPVPNKQELFAFVFGNSLYFGGGNNGQSGSTNEFYELKLD